MLVVTRQSTKHKETAVEINERLRDKPPNRAHKIAWGAIGRTKAWEDLERKEGGYLSLKGVEKD